MNDREKVIDGLREAAAYFRSSFDAMYGTVACEKFRSWVDAIEHALALLKAHEPRLMTLGEALRADWCFVEIRKYLRSGDLFYYDTFSGILVENSGIYVIHKRGTSAYVDVDRYGIDWRCWTSRPTDEQRKATPWN